MNEDQEPKEDDDVEEGQQLLLVPVPAADAIPPCTFPCRSCQQAGRQ